METLTEVICPGKLVKIYNITMLIYTQKWMNRKVTLNFSFAATLKVHHPLTA